MNDEEIEKQLEEEFCDVGIDIEGNLVFLEKREWVLQRNVRLCKPA